MRIACAAALAVSVCCRAASAGALQVAPVNLQVTGTGGATALQLTNGGAQPLVAQIRVFRWSQTNGVETLEPTDAVVASPPAATLPPHAQYTVRVVRLDPTPVVGEESYRLIVDELPDANRARNGAINMVLRYSVPLFFTEPSASQPRLAWSLRRGKGGRLVASAVNEGQRHLRLSEMTIRAGGAKAAFGEGLVGYVLGKSSMSFSSKNVAGAPGAGSASISANTDMGRLDAIAPLGK